MNYEAGTGYWCQFLDGVIPVSVAQHAEDIARLRRGAVDLNEEKSLMHEARRRGHARDRPAAGYTRAPGVPGIRFHTANTFTLAGKRPKIDDLSYTSGSDPRPYTVNLDHVLFPLLVVFYFT